MLTISRLDILCWILILLSVIASIYSVFFIPNNLSSLKYLIMQTLSCVFEIEATLIGAAELVGIWKNWNNFIMEELKGKKQVIKDNKYVNDIGEPSLEVVLNNINRLSQENDFREQHYKSLFNASEKKHMADLIKNHLAKVTAIFLIIEGLVLNLIYLYSA